MTYETYYLKLVDAKNNELLAPVIEAQLNVMAINNRWDVTPADIYQFKAIRYIGPRKAEIRVYRDLACLDWVTSLPLEERLYGGRYVHLRPLDKPAKAC